MAAPDPTTRVYVALQLPYRLDALGVGFEFVKFESAELAMRARRFRAVTQQGALKTVGNSALASTGILCATLTESADRAGGVTALQLGGKKMAKNQNTFAKRQREMDKKRKADEKRAKRKLKKEEPSEPVYGIHPDDEEADDQSDVVDTNSDETV